MNSAKTLRGSWNKQGLELSWGRSQAARDEHNEG